MAQTIQADIHQAVGSWKFAAATLAFCALIFLSAFDTLLAVAGAESVESGFHGRLISDALTSDGVLLALPVLCALPYGAAYMEEVKTGFVKLYLSRTTRRGYVMGKFGGCVLSGGLVPVVGTLLAYGISAAVFTPMEEGNPAGTAYLLTLLPDLGRFFLSGGFWGFVGMLASSQLESKYIAYAAPFVFYYLLVILQERYFTTLYVLNPEGWLLAGEEWVLGQWSPAVVVIELMVIALLLFSQAVGRRIRTL